MDSKDGSDLFCFLSVITVVVAFFFFPKVHDTKVSYDWGGDTSGIIFQVCVPTFPSLWDLWNSNLSFFGSLNRDVYNRGKEKAYSM